MADVTPSPNLEDARESIRAVLLQAEPFQDLYKLAQHLRDSQMSQSVMRDLFTEFHLKHREDQNDIRYDAISDRLDFIVGWCQPDHHLFSDTEKLESANA